MLRTTVAWAVILTLASATPREKRQVDETPNPDPANHWNDTHPMDSEGGSSGGGLGLGEILGLLFLVCCILYCIGIGYKIFKICKGTYVEEEPVFLKYK